MRNLFFLLLVSLTVITGCRDDFSLEAPYQDIPVVFAYLNAEDNLHYVRVQKAFLGQNGDGTLAAAVEDSLYYSADAATVTLTQGMDEVVLERVNAAELGIERPAGAFFSDANILYRLSRNDLDLRAGNQVTLTIERPGEEDATATTLLLAPIDVILPIDNILIQSFNQAQNWRWNVTPGTRVFDVRLRVNLREFFTNDPSMNRERTVEWAINRQLVAEAGENRVVLQFNNELFWQFLGGALEPIDGVRRVIDDLDLVITGVGDEIQGQLELEAANGGITSAQAIPVYSNVNNGLGIVTSRTFGIVEGISFDSRNLDSLRNGIYTRTLGFQ